MDKQSADFINTKDLLRLEPNVLESLERFLGQSAFPAQGGIITDLDGTVVYEHQGRIYLPPEVEGALKALYYLNCPIILNTLRFPLSIIRTLGRDWFSLANKPIPVVSLNGAQLGYLTMAEEDELIFEEITAFPLLSTEIDEILQGVNGLLQGGIKDLLVFAYPRDWRVGEIIWTPVPEKVAHVKEKYLSASSVTAVEFEKWRVQLLQEEYCMLFLLIDVPQDRLMAYQHTKRSNFFTHKGVDKQFGTQQMAQHLGLDLKHSVGAGDTEMDIFLNSTGLSVLVGNQDLEFRGQLETIKLKNSLELGAVLQHLALVHQSSPV